MIKFTKKFIYGLSIFITKYLIHVNHSKCPSKLKVISVNVCLIQLLYFWFLTSLLFNLLILTISVTIITNIAIYFISSILESNLWEISRFRFFHSLTKGRNSRQKCDPKERQKGNGNIWKEEEIWQGRTHYQEHNWNCLSLSLSPFLSFPGIVCLFSGNFFSFLSLSISISCSQSKDIGQSQVKRWWNLSEGKDRWKAEEMNSGMVLTQEVSCLLTLSSSIPINFHDDVVSQQLFLVLQKEENRRKEAEKKKRKKGEINTPWHALISWYYAFIALSLSLLSLTLSLSLSIIDWELRKRTNNSVLIASNQIKVFICLYCKYFLETLTCHHER